MNNILILAAVAVTAIIAAAPADATDVFTDNRDGTVFAITSKLTWQQKVAREPGSKDSAAAYCSGLKLGGKTDWRLPTYAELQSLWNAISADRQLGRKIFPKYASPGPANPTTGWAAAYWSATSVKIGDQDAAAAVDFANGQGRAVTLHGIRIDLYVRCVS